MHIVAARQLLSTTIINLPMTQTSVLRSTGQSLLEGGMQKTHSTLPLALDTLLRQGVSEIWEWAGLRRAHLTCLLGGQVRHRRHPL